MLARSVLNHILDDEALTRHLGDAEARVLVEWLVEEAEALGDTHTAEDALQEVQRLRRLGRALSRFVSLWAIDHERGAATQLAATERFDWPLPDGDVDPDVLMQHVTWWEGQKRRAA